MRLRLAHTPGADESGNSRGTASFLIGVQWVEERAEEPDTNLARSRGFSRATPLAENSSARNTLSLWMPKRRWSVATSRIRALWCLRGRVGDAGRGRVLTDWIAAPPAIGERGGEADDWVRDDSGDWECPLEPEYEEPAL